MVAPMASTAKDTAPMTQTGGEGAWIAEPLEAAISIFSFFPGISMAEASAMDMPGKKEKMDMAASSGSAIHAPSPPVWVMGAVSFAVLAIGATIALTFGGGGH